MLESLKSLDEIRLNFSETGLLILNITLAFIMFGVALDIKPVHFKNVVKNPKSAIIGFLSQFVILPAATVALILIFRNFITPTIAMGMILVASCPGGNISNFISSLAKANVALSVSLTALATSLAILLTPLNFSIWGKIYVESIKILDAGKLLVPIEIDPWQVFQTVFILLGIPLILGMWFNNLFPGITAKILKPVKTTSIVIFSLMVIAMFSANYEYFIDYIKFVFIIVLFHNFTALFSGYGFASIFRIFGKDRKTISIETGIQNSGLALVLLFNEKIFPGTLKNGGMAFIAAWWGIWHILSGLAIAAFWSVKTAKK